MPPQNTDVVADEEYELTTADYDAMGTGDKQPGKHDNFAYNIDPNEYLPNFCTTKYVDKQVGFICKIIYKYYSNRETTTQAKFYKKGANGFVEETGFKADKSYIFTSEDYADIAGADENKAYNPAKEMVASITERITVMKFDGKEWKLSNLISDIKELSLTNAEYTKLVEWVKENKPEFMSTQNTTSEYYFGADTKNNNINNKYSTWTQYYNVDGYLNDLKDEEIQVIMDERLAKEAFPLILLPDMVDNPDPDISYTVIYKIYGGRGNGNYAMSFYYSKEDNAYTWDEMAPVMQ